MIHRHKKKQKPTHIMIKPISKHLSFHSEFKMKSLLSKTTVTYLEIINIFIILKCFSPFIIIEAYNKKLYLLLHV